MNTVKQPMSLTTPFTAVMNLYHLFYVHNIKEVLIDKVTKKFVKGVFDSISRLRVDFNITEAITPDYLNCKNLVEYDDVYEYLTDSKLKQKYDLIVVHENNFHLVIPFLHRANFIFIVTEKDSTKKEYIYIPYTKINDCFEGVLYVNDFHSIIFPTVNLNIYEQLYVRDKPYRYLKKSVQLINTVLKNAKTIVEIGSCRTPLKHDLDEIHVNCCNDSHSTFFWCLTKCHVSTVDINYTCENVISNAIDEGVAEVNGTLDVHIMDGLNFLKNYSGDPIDFLFLDAWDVIPGKDYAEKHLEAFNYASKKLAKNCIISIDDTDIAGGGKGKLLVPKLLELGWIILYRGRHTVLYRGKIDNLFSKIN
jgi:hypothetical protein